MVLGVERIAMLKYGVNDIREFYKSNLDFLLNSNEISYNDLINLLLKNHRKKLISEKLFQLGHEHEIDGDIFDMELTPNRGDCLSLMGLQEI